MTESAWLRWLPDAIRNRQPSPWWFLPPVLIGVLVLVLVIVFSPGTPHGGIVETATPVRVMSLAPVSISPTFTGYGQVQPIHEWQAVAQVPGSITWRHPALKAGATFEKGETLLRIDPEDYELAVARADAQVGAARASVREIESRRRDLQQSLEIEREALAIAARDFERNRELAADGHISEMSLSQERQTLLRGRQAVKTVETQLNLVPAQLDSARARLREAEASLSKARRDLERTTITMPFHGRIERVLVDDSQFVPLGQPMVRAEGTTELEVLVQAPWDELAARFPEAMRDRKASAGLPALLSHAGGHKWKGRVERIDPGLSRANRSAQVYVGMELDADESSPAPYQYPEVRISGPALQDRFEVPRTSLRDGRLMLVDANDRLAWRDVSIDYVEADRAVIRSGVEAGDRVVVSNLLYPASGMKLEPRATEDAP